MKRRLIIDQGNPGWGYSFFAPDMSSAYSLYSFASTMVTCYSAANFTESICIMRNWLEYIPFIIIASIIRTMPRSLALSLGGWLGNLGRFLQPRRVRISRDNLKLAFPEMNKENSDEIIGKMFVQLGKSFIEMLRLDKFQGKKDLESCFHINNQENVEGALKLERGCIILTGHVGFWEAGTFFMPQLGFPFGVVAKPMRNTLTDNFFRKMRTSSGSYIINSRKGARAILKSLQKNHCVGILLDQHIKGQGSEPVPFFGRPAHTTTIITQMATRYHVPIVPAFVYRNDDNSYSCEFGEKIMLDGDLSNENIRNNTALLNQVIEKGIRKNVSQWFWLHRRWRACCEK